MRSLRQALVVVFALCAALASHRVFAQGNNNVWTTSSTNIYNNNSGFVGIGSSNTPQSTLHVFGEFSVSGLSGDVRWMPRGGSGTTLMMYNPSGTDLRIFGASDLFTFTSSGNFGIGLGSTAPTAKLHILGAPATSSSFVTWAGADYNAISVRSQQLSSPGTHVFSLLNPGSTKYSSLLGLTEDQTDGSSQNHAGIVGVGVSRSIGTQNYMAGVEGDAYRAYVTTGTTAILAGLAGYAEVDGGTASLTAGVYAWGPWTAPGALSALNAGVYIQDQNTYNPSVTKNYQIYSATGTTPFVVTPNGSVGIGNDGPQYPLDVKGTVYLRSGPDELSPRLIVYDDSFHASYVTYGADTYTRYKSTGPFMWKSVPTQGTRLTAAGTQTMILDQGGNLWTAGQIHATGAITSDAGINAVYQDVAEWVPSNESLDAGTVVVLSRERRNEVIASSSAYDTGVAGVVSEHPGNHPREGRSRQGAGCDHRTGEQSRRQPCSHCDRRSSRHQRPRRYGDEERAARDQRPPPPSAGYDHREGARAAHVGDRRDSRSVVAPVGELDDSRESSGSSCISYDSMRAVAAGHCRCGYGARGRFLESRRGFVPHVARRRDFPGRTEGHRLRGVRALGARRNGHPGRHATRETPLYTPAARYYRGRSLQEGDFAFLTANDATGVADGLIGSSSRESAMCFPGTRSSTRRAVRPSCSS